MSDIEQRHMDEAKPQPVAWMHPRARWVSEKYGSVLAHCRNDGPYPEPLYDATALAAAEQRGREEERERAAKVAEDHRLDGPLYDAALDCGTWPRAVAAAIRQPSTGDER